MENSTAAKKKGETISSSCDQSTKPENEGTANTENTSVGGHDKGTDDISPQTGNAEDETIAFLEEEEEDTIVFQEQDDPENDSDGVEKLRHSQVRFQIADAKIEHYDERRTREENFRSFLDYATGSAEAEEFETRYTNFESNFDIETGQQISFSGHESMGSLSDSGFNDSSTCRTGEEGPKKSPGIPLSSIQTRALVGTNPDEMALNDERKDSWTPLPNLSNRSGHNRQTSASSTDLSDFRATPGGSNHMDILMKSSIRIAINRTVDLDSERQQGFRGQSAQVRDPSDRFPHCRQRRGMKSMAQIVNPFWRKKALQPDPIDKKGRPLRLSQGLNRRKMASNRDYTQYRITSIDTTYEHQTGKLHLGGFHAGIYDDETPDQGTGPFWHIKPNTMVVTYLFWAFRSSFMAVLLSAAVWFTSLTFIFALCIYVIGLSRPNCIHVNGVDFGESNWFTNMMDAYALSWTTFSTVGYGLVFPATSATTTDVRRCFGITVFATLESFVGILFASFWGAIFLSKVTRVSSFAQVTFSDPIVLRYGPGLRVQADDDGSDDDEERKARREAASLYFTRSKLPCPILEFRVLNRLEGQKHGEIIDASMNIVASIDEDQIHGEAKPKTKKKRRKKKAKRFQGRGVKDYMDDDENVEPDAAEQSRKKLTQLLKQQGRRWSIHPPEEDITGDVVSRKIFAKLEIESQEHPFFKRIWNARHVLDQDSPLLKQDAKDLILLNGGHWPEELNTAEKVRQSMHFDQILVSLSGTSNADCNSVYAQKVYDYVDLCVGYRFCNMLYKNPQGGLSADPDLLNDVTEQYGGGGEDLHDRDVETTSEIFIL